MKQFFNQNKTHPELWDGGNKHGDPVRQTNRNHLHKSISNQLQNGRQYVPNSYPKIAP